MRAIIRFFAKEHLFGNLVTLLVIIFGLYSLAKIRRDIWPKVNMHITTVSAFLGGASAEQIEKLVINPIESSLKEVDGVKKVMSTSTENTGVVVLQLDPDARDPDKTNGDIQRVVDRTDDLPDEVEKPVVTVIDSGVVPVIEVTVAGANGPMVTRDVAKKIADDLSLMDGVARVLKQGYRKKEYQVIANSEKLAQRNVPLTSLINSIKMRNISMPGGSMNDDLGNERLVRTEAQISEPKDLLKIDVVANDSGFGSKLRDVAQVNETLAKPDRLYRASGEDSVNLVISKKENYDVLKLVGEIRQKVNEFSETFKDKVKVGISNDFSVYLKTRLAALSSNMIIGLFLVLVILTLFLPWQVTLVVAMGIPIALLSSILAIYLSGYSLNLISLMGLIIVLGMLVDDAIVVSENIWRHIEEGDDILKSVVDGASEVFSPVLASVLTTVSAFGPMMFMTGVFGAFVFEIPLMVILALFFSMTEAFVIMPSHFASWVSPFVSKIKDRQKKGKHWFDRVADKYANYVQWSLRYRYFVLLIVFFIFGGSVSIMAISGRFVLFPADDVEIFFVQAEGKKDISLEHMNELVTPIEQEVRRLVPSEDLVDIVTHIGIIQQDMMDPITRRGSNYANIRVTLTAQSERKRSARSIIESLRGKIKAPDQIEKLDFELVRQGPPQGRPISMNLIGENFDELNKMADEFMQELKKIEGIIDVRHSYQMGKKEWQVSPNYNIATFGLTATDVATTVAAAFDGIVASSVRNLDEEIDIRVKLEKTKNHIEDQLKELKVGNNQGNLISLSTLANFEPTRSVTSIGHSNFKRVINVSASVNDQVITGLTANELVQPILANIVKKKPGYSFESSGEDKDTQESMQSLVVAFIFAACIIFSLLIVTFRNLMQPLLILTSIPMGFVGVIFAMALHGRPFSFMAMLGVIALAGVIVNNSIVFTDFVNKRRIKGENTNESIVASARIRLRPIVLTTVTTISGLLPTAYGDKLRLIFGFGGGDPFIIPIALALGWGLAFGTLMTGLFFPAFVRILDDIIGLFNKEHIVS